jgi:hypothetical protein
VCRGADLFRRVPRLILYTLFRRIHLFTGLLLLVFVLMYFVTGYVIVHRPWFGKSNPRITTRTEALNLRGRPSDEQMAEYLQDTFDLRGQPGAANHRADGSIRFTFARPGTSFEAVILPGAKQVTITRKDLAATDVANGLHRLRGYRGGWVYWLWALLYDLASAALIVFALTGIVLWYQSTSRRLGGWICLSLSFSFTAAMILYLMLSI